MSSLGNRQVMAANLKRLIDDAGRKRTDVAKGADVPYSSLCDWMNQNRYPRIDNIERLANYLGVNKSDLVEPPEEKETPSAIEKHLVESFRKLSDTDKERVMKIIEVLGETL